MKPESKELEGYFQHLNGISFLGRTYKRFFTSPLVFLMARRFGPRIIEVGSGIGSGVLGTFPARVVGIDINPQAVELCIKRGLSAQLINSDGSFPIADGSFDACILDNVIEHIENPKTTLDECWRITSPHGAMLIGVPGVRGFAHDPDHKVFYDKEKLANLDARWKLVSLFAVPTFFLSQRLSEATRRYGLLAVYKKKP